MSDKDELLKKRSVDDIEEKGFLEKEKIAERRKKLKRKKRKKEIKNKIKRLWRLI